MSEQLPYSGYATVNCHALNMYMYACKDTNYQYQMVLNSYSCYKIPKWFSHYISRVWWTLSGSMLSGRLTQWHKMYQYQQLLHRTCRKYISLWKSYGRPFQAFSAAKLLRYIVDYYQVGGTFPKGIYSQKRHPKLEIKHTKERSQRKDSSDYIFHIEFTNSYRDTLTVDVRMYSVSLYTRQGGFFSPS